MSTYAQVIASIQSALEESSTAPAPGLHAYPDPREDTLLTAARGKFDGSYLLRLERGPDIWPDSSTDPRHFKGVLAVEIGTELSDSMVTQDTTAEERGRLAMQSLIYSDRVDAGAIYRWEEPTKQRQLKDKRLVWTVRLHLRWSET